MNTIHANFYNPRFTKNAWAKTYGKNKLNDWERLTHPNHINDYILEIVKAFNKGEYEENTEHILKIVPIDGEYFEWLEENKLPNTLRNRSTYIAKVVDNENAYRLMKKNGWDVEYDVFGIPLIIDTRKKKTKYFISKTTQREIMNYIKEKYGLEDVLVFKTLVKCSKLFQQKMEYEKKMELFASGEIEGENEGEQTENFSCKKEINEMVIPVVVKRKIKSPIVDINAYKKEIFNFEKRLDFDEDFKRMAKMIKEDVKDECFLKSSLVKINHLIETIDDFYDSLLESGHLKEVDYGMFPHSRVCKIKIEI